MTKKPSTAVGAMSPDDTRLVKKRVLGNNRSANKLPQHLGMYDKGWHYCLLKEDLLPATNPLTGYKQATAKLIFYAENSDSLSMVEINDTDFDIEITNRSTTQQASAGDLILTRFVVREWCPIWQSSGSALRHGIVRSSDGCGYYTVELGTWSGNLNTSGTGIGSDSSGIDRNCDICYDVVNEGTADCAVTLSYPSCPVTGIGEYVRAYHRASVLVPLVVGSACMLTGQGGDDPSSSTDSSGAIEDVWHILDGLQEHTVQYKDTESCCTGEGETGVYTILTRTPIIFAAKVCAPINCGSCSTTSSG